MITLCTLFDSAYLTRGLCLIDSLRRHAPDAVLYVLALDDKTLSYFDDVDGRGVVPIPLSEIETADLLRAKANRTHEEYCWTLASAFALYCADTFKPDSIAYIDADCYLFGGLNELYDEVENAPVAITPHRYAPNQVERLYGAGEFNVGWVYFSRDGYPCLRHWRDQCVEWCYHVIERDGRFGDQGYLNDWPDRWRAHVVYNLGVNLAPWNQGQYVYTLDNSRIVVSNRTRGDPLAMYHFHGFQSPYHMTDYKLNPIVEQFVYGPYRRDYVRRMG